MTINQLEKFGRWVLRISPLVIAPVAFFVSQPWLKQQDAAIALGIAVAASIFLTGYGVLLAVRVGRRMDEVEFAGQRFASAQGCVIGFFAAVLVMAFPPAITALANLATSIGAGSQDEAVRVAITIGLMLVGVLQTLSIVAVYIWWQRRMGGLA
jgi:hypothetical protein